MILEGLPKEVTEACVPILQKYGIKQSRSMGDVLKSIGGAFKMFAGATSKDPRKVKRMSVLLLGTTRKALEHNGLTDPIQRDNCAKDLIEALLEIFKKEVAKHE